VSEPAEPVAGDRPGAADRLVEDAFEFGHASNLLMEAGGTGGQVGAIATGSVTAGGQRSVTAGGHAHDVGTNVGGTGLGERAYRPWRPAG